MSGILDVCTPVWGEATPWPVVLDRGHNKGRSERHVLLPAVSVSISTIPRGV